MADRTRKSIICIADLPAKLSIAITIQPCFVPYARRRGVHARCKAHSSACLIRVSFNSIGFFFIATINNHDSGCGSVESMNRYGTDLVGEGRGSVSECFLNIGWKTRLKKF
ncbi:hypothetical protein P8452_44665 [Trifolium repens]|nr:hypothetical protein P8452_44665 [Trifolium repens]